MANKKLNEKKAKAKERAKLNQKVQKKLIKARKDRYDRELDKTARMMRARPEPIRNKPDAANVEEVLKYNLEILKALEAEYIKSQEGRKDLHEQLEKEGYKSLAEKVEALKLQDQQAAQKIVLENTKID